MAALATASFFFIDDIAPGIKSPSSLKQMAASFIWADTFLKDCSSDGDKIGG